MIELLFGIGIGIYAGTYYDFKPGIKTILISIESINPKDISLITK